MFNIYIIASQLILAVSVVYSYIIVKSSSPNIALKLRNLILISSIAVSIYVLYESQLNWTVSIHMLAVLMCLGLSAIQKTILTDNGKILASYKIQIVSGIAVAISNIGFLFFENILFDIPILILVGKLIKFDEMSHSLSSPSVGIKDSLKSIMIGFPFYMLSSVDALSALILKNFNYAEIYVSQRVALVGINIINDASLREAQKNAKNEKWKIQKKDLMYNSIELLLKR